MKRLRIPIIFLVVFMLAGLNLSAQPGCPSVDAGPDQNLGCTTPCTNITATVLTTGTTSTYAVSTIPFAPPYAFNTGTPILVNTDDIWSGAIPLPFNFCYYGNNYSQIVVGSNGCITFDISQAGGYCPWGFSASIPSASLPLNSIFGPYHDIDPSVAGSMYYAILGTYPCRTFVVNFYNIPMFSCNALIATHQIVLYESTNIIEVYMLNKPLCGSWNSGNACVGIQNINGTIGLAAPLRNTSQWSAANEAWRFTPNGTPNYTIEWLDGGLNPIGNTATMQVCPTQNETYTAVVTYNNCNGNQVVLSDQVNITLAAGFSVSVNPTDTTICLGESVQLNAIGSPAYTYTWSPATGLSGTSGQTVTATPLVTTTYTLTATDNLNCTANIPITITVNPPPVVSVSPNNAYICAGSQQLLSASGATTYIWAPSGTLSSSTGDSVVASPPTTTTYTVTGDNSGCTASTTVTLNVDPMPVLVLNPTSASICSGDQTTLSASGANTYTWSPGTGLSSTSGASVTANPVITTTYTVTGATNPACTDSESITVTVNLSPTVTITPPSSTVCSGEAVQLTASGAATYNWSPAAGLSTTTGAIVVATPTNTTTYTVIGTDANGCTNLGTAVINITLMPNVAIYSSKPEICRGDTAHLTVTGTGTVTWDPPTGLSSSTLNTVVASPLSTITYTVTVNNNGCSGSDAFTLEVNPLPNVDFSADVTEGCENLIVHFTDLTTPDVQSWTWNFGDAGSQSNISYLQDPAYLFDDPGSYDITLSAVSMDGCEMTMSVPKMITVHPDPVAIFGSNPEVANILDPDIWFFDNSYLADYWFWDFGEDYYLGNHSEDQNPIHTYSDTGRYIVTLVVKTEFGCLDTIKSWIIIEPNITLYVPGGFTPNNDGNNEFFYVKGEGILESDFQIRVFNRYGEMVYFSGDLYGQWDGTYKGKKSEVGVYVWMVTFKDVKYNDHSKKGVFTLYR